MPTCKYTKLLLFLTLFILNFAVHSCASSKSDKPLTESQLHKELLKQRKKEHEIARRANERAKKDFWDHQSPDMKKRIQETHERDKKRIKAMRKQKRK
jgi:hypothetical protein